VRSRAAGFPQYGRLGIVVVVPDDIADTGNGTPGNLRS
jgi:hypothetical protein